MGIIFDFRSKLRFAFPLIILFISLSACQSRANRLVVFAASSLTEAFTEIAVVFSAEHPDIAIVPSFAASSALRIQIEEGASADIFASANPKHVQLLDDQGLLAPGSQQVFATNKMGIAYSFVDANEFSLDLLTNPGLRIVMALPEVPAGAYTLDVLDALGEEYGSDFSKAILENVVSYEDSVRQALLKVEIGEADAAFVYASDSRASENVHFFQFPDDAQPDIEYIVAVVYSGAGERAQAFIDFLVTQEGQAILHKWGFAAP